MDESSKQAYQTKNFEDAVMVVVCKTIVRGTRNMSGSVHCCGCGIFVHQWEDFNRFIVFHVVSAVPRELAFVTTSPIAFFRQHTVPQPSQDALTDENVSCHKISCGRL